MCRIHPTEAPHLTPSQDGLSWVADGAPGTVRPGDADSQAFCETHRTTCRNLSEDLPEVSA